LELIKDYDLEIHYHPGKANLVADVLSPKEHVHATIVAQLPDELVEDFRRLNLGIVAHTEGITIEVEPTFEQEICKGQISDAKIQEIKDLMAEGRGPDFIEDEQGTIWFKNRICVSEIDSLRETILKEAHDSD
jgi:transposase InsO family protein